MIFVFADLVMALLSSLAFFAYELQNICQASAVPEPSSLLLQKSVSAPVFSKLFLHDLNVPLRLPP